VWLDLRAGADVVAKAQLDVRALVALRALASVQLSGLGALAPLPAESGGGKRGVRVRVHALELTAEALARCKLPTPPSAAPPAQPAQPAQPEPAANGAAAAAAAAAPTAAAAATAAVAPPPAIAAAAPPPAASAAAPLSFSIEIDFPGGAPEGLVRSAVVPATPSGAADARAAGGGGGGGGGGARADFDFSHRVPVAADGGAAAAAAAAAGGKAASVPAPSAVSAELVAALASPADDDSDLVFVVRAHYLAPPPAALAAAAGAAVSPLTGKADAALPLKGKADTTSAKGATTVVEIGEVPPRRLPIDAPARPAHPTRVPAFMGVCVCGVRSIHAWLLHLLLRSSCVLPHLDLGLVPLFAFLFSFFSSQAFVNLEALLKAHKDLTTATLPIHPSGPLWQQPQQPAPGAAAAPPQLGATAAAGPLGVLTVSVEAVEALAAAMETVVLASARVDVTELSLTAEAAAKVGGGPLAVRVEFPVTLPDAALAAAAGLRTAAVALGADRRARFQYSARLPLTDPTTRGLLRAALAREGGAELVFTLVRVGGREGARVGGPRADVPIAEACVDLGALLREGGRDPRGASLELAPLDGKTGQPAGGPALGALVVTVEAAAMLRALSATRLSPLALREKAQE
jgi:hypothetical protein